MNIRFKEPFLINLFVFLSFDNVSSRKLNTETLNEHPLHNVIDVIGAERLEFKLPNSRETIDTPENPVQE